MMEQWFLKEYYAWWSKLPPPSLADCEFTILVLRVCSYASQFLPSPSHTIDSIRGVSLTDIRRDCDEIADSLASTCSSLDTRGTLLRVQQLAFVGLRLQCEGRTTAFWDTLGNLLRVAQRVGIHKEVPASIPGPSEPEKEMRRRCFCILYIWDSLLSRQLDRIPFLPSGLAATNLPRMRLLLDPDDIEAPETFTERLLQVRLANFWRSLSPNFGLEYDMTEAETRYERFCAQFLNTLPPAFALQPNKMWDARIPMLSRQRQVLHITIWDTVCWNFKPLLLLPSTVVQSLPSYKQVLLLSQKKMLAMAALSMLAAVDVLHNLMGNSHTRSAPIIFATFEAAVIIASICLDPAFVEEIDTTIQPSVLTSLMNGGTSLSKDGCLRALHSAQKRLHMLAEVSSMADAGSRVLNNLVERLNPRSCESEELDLETVVPEYWANIDHDPAVQVFGLSGFLSSSVPDDPYPDWDMLGP
ncbi:hypothetical protein PFICI_00491 [Pestalotiopsis fici W106-1]|uniref:Xylanolytic transcriptional activator regulatory domain-containing protein n=1 Tax=Pestalotiopsis fici (strain W106-1 / CGMCC3.15140) TaxID=1229662 RepID=W3XKS7_PESFW|nr:uncharacterized protein PFICI_00491 [Pestalotiopsis fici W106-1]ETS86663.1 hypothetical protein PFICI_00491 [Pestalotiopsis fici W106-1]